MNELQLRHDEQIRELQNHFQNLLDQKINQIQSDATSQIMSLKNQERELESLLEEKMIQLEREYVKTTYHEQIVGEKDILVEKLRNEMANREAEYKQEIAHKLRVQEEKLGEDFNFQEKKLKSTLIIYL